MKKIHCFDDIHVDKGETMNIDTSFASNAYQDVTKSVQKRLEDTKDLTAKDITNQYLIEYQMQIISESKTQSYQQARVLSLADIGYEGKPKRGRKYVGWKVARY
ncbi:MAG TPA: hypothetical protein EYG93_04985 [Sulfurospirillum arcachonense]|nr:hypothetical protein [Sulfurospirillum arcachonense]